MKRIVILGAGVSGRAAVKEFKEKVPDCDITIIDKDSCYFSKEDIIFTPGKISNRLNLQDWAKDSGVNFINDKVERINQKRKKIYFKQNEPIGFDQLFIAAGLSPKKLSLKGEQKEGTFYLGEIDAFKLKDLLKISNEAVVYVSSQLGIRLALSLSSLGKEVRIIAQSLDFLGEDKEKTIESLQQNNIQLHLECMLEEIVGEGRVKAVKVVPLKVLSAQLVFIDNGFIPNLKFFEEEVDLKDDGTSNYEGIQFKGSILNGGQLWQNGLV